MAIKTKQKSTGLLFSDLKEGLVATIDLEKGDHVSGGRATVFVVMPVRKRTPALIKALRLKLCMSQSIFAHILGVTNKAVESWEAGRKNPSGPVLRIFEILEKEAMVLQRVGIFNREIA